MASGTCEGVGGRCRGGESARAGWRADGLASAAPAPSPQFKSTKAPGTVTEPKDRSGLSGLAPATAEQRGDKNVKNGRRPRCCRSRPLFLPRVISLSFYPHPKSKVEISTDICWDMLAVDRESPAGVGTSASREQAGFATSPLSRRVFGDISSNLRNNRNSPLDKSPRYSGNSSMDTEKAGRRISPNRRRFIEAAGGPSFVALQPPD